MKKLLYILLLLPSLVMGQNKLRLDQMWPIGANKVYGTNGSGVRVGIDISSLGGSPDTASYRTVSNSYSKAQVQTLLGSYVPATRTINGHNLSSNFTLSSSDIGEGSNLYYTASRFNTAFSGKSTSDLAEGTNLYYTSARFNTAFSGKSTSDLAEGTNLYFTNARGIGSTLTGWTSGAGTVSSSDNVLQALQKIDGNVAANTTAIAGKEPAITNLPVSKGGTNSTTALNSNRIIVSSGGAIVERAAQTPTYLSYYDSNGLPSGSASMQFVDNGTNKKNVGFGVGTLDQNNLTGEGNSAGTSHLFEIVNDNSTQQMFRMSSYGSGSTYQNNLHFYRSRGTGASPTAIQSGDFLASYGYRGQMSSTAGTGMSGSAAAYQVVASENWSTSANGVRHQFQVTPNGSTAASRVNTLLLNGDGSVHLTKQSGFSFYRTTGILNIDLSSSGYSSTSNGIIIQSATSNAAAIILGESTSNEGYLNRQGSTVAGNWGGTSQAIANTTNLQAGPSTNQVLRLAGNAVVNMIGTTSTNAGTRLSSAGLVVTTMAGVHTDASTLFHVLQPTKGTALTRYESTATTNNILTTLYQNKVTTTDATVTTLHTFATASDVQYTLRATVTAKRTGGASGTAGDGASYIIAVRAKNVGGTVTLGTPVSLLTDEDQAGWDVTFSVSGTNVLVRVTGAASNNISWSMNSLEGGEGNN